MPNWVTCKLDVRNVSATRLNQIREFVSSDHFDDEGVFQHVPVDFNKIIPMPEELRVISGSTENEALDLYEAYCRPESKYDECLGIDEKTFAEIRMSLNDCLMAFNRIPRPVSIYPEDIHRLSKKFSLYEGDGKEYPVLVCGRRYFLNKILYGSTTWYGWSRFNWGTKWNACRSSYTENGWQFETAWCAPLEVIRVLSEIYRGAQFELKYADEDIGNNCGEIHYLNGAIEYERCDFECKMEAQEFAINVIYGCPPVDAGYKFDEENGRWEYDFDAEE